jgi:hypothetical protein
VLETLGYHPPSIQCFYFWVDTSSVGRLLVLEGIIRSVVSVSITRSIPLLLVDYRSSKVSSARYRPNDRNTDYWADDTLED